jgi:phosphate transport system protein
MADHLLKRFDEELNKLRYRLVKMGTLVQQQIEFAINSILENNIEHAKLVLEFEKKVNRLDIKIDKQCLRIFALHQPVAMDLRLVLSAVSINDNMEFIGDLTTNIAQNVIDMNIPPGLIERTKINEMGALINQITALLMDSYVNMNNDLAIEVIKKVSEADKLVKENFSVLTNLMKADNSLIEIGCYLIDIDRNLHSISRQIRTIAQELVFLFEAKMIKHQSIEEMLLVEPEEHFEK